MMMNNITDNFNLFQHRRRRRIPILINFTKLNNVFDIIYVTSIGIAYSSKLTILNNIPETIINIIKLYQIEGAIKILNCFNTKMNGCMLADDMGLGKTLQIMIIVINYYIYNNNLKNNKILIIVPKSVVQVWLTHFKKYIPQINLCFYERNNTKFCINSSTIILTTYDTVKLNLNILQKISFFMIILDEAQKIKNPKTQLSKAIKSLKSIKKLVVTGTPMENKFNDFINLFDLLRKNYLNEYWDCNNLDNPEIIKEIHKRIKPYIVRRLKKNILSLPPIKFKFIQCPYTQEQRNLFKTLDFKIINTTYKIFLNTYGLSSLSKAKLIFNHPAHYVGTNKHTTIKQSGKMQKLFDIIKKIPANEKIVIFTSYVKTGNLIAYLTRQYNINYLTLYGKHSLQQRSDIVNKFQYTFSNIKILIISLKTGGTGITLTRANHVIHYDPWWNFAATQQASDRVYRIGQKRPVTVYYLFTKNTFEETIAIYAQNCHKIFENVFDNLDYTNKQTLLIRNKAFSFRIINKVPFLFKNSLKNKKCISNKKKFLKGRFKIRYNTDLYEKQKPKSDLERLNIINEKVIIN